MRPYRDRAEAGQLLAGALERYAGRTDLTVLGLPRGGVPVAHEVARALGAPLDVFVVRKLGVPGHEELAMGAIAAGGVRVVNHDVVAPLGISTDALDAVTEAERAELERRERAYRDGRPGAPIEDRVAIVVDDGLATGSTMRAAVAALRLRNPASVVVAVPVGAASTVAMLEGEADDVVCVLTPNPFYAVGTWYEDFGATSDEEVRSLLK